MLLANGKEIVAVEVKAKLKVANVEKHEENLGRFREVFHEYRDKEVLGAVAALSFDSDSDKYAWRRGMFVLKPAHGLARIATTALVFCQSAFEFTSSNPKNAWKSSPSTLFVDGAPLSFRRFVLRI